jgi:hypothetical protein
MNDPFSNLRNASDPETLAELVDVCGIEGLSEFDDVPSFDGPDNPEVDVSAQLSGDKSFIHRPSRRLFIDYRANPDTLRHLERLPRERETLHGVICGKYALWELVPALIERTRRKIADLHIATLSYGKSNAEDLLGLLDGGQVKRVSLLVSYYFKAQNRHLYDSLVPPLRERGHRVLAMRTHAKILLVKMAGGGSYVVEASANLRSCKNVEQFCLTRDRQLYRFHRDWLEGELLHGREEGTDDSN